MPIDYSKFDKIVDSDDEDEPPTKLDFRDFFPSSAREMDEDEEEPESPRIALARSAGLTSTEKATGTKNTAADVSMLPPASLERFNELSDGSADLVQGEDTLELISVTKATLQSSLSDIQDDATGAISILFPFARALKKGLSETPKPVAFAKEQAPELVGELIRSADAMARVEADLAVELCEVLKLMTVKCKPQEVYTFLLEALCRRELSMSLRPAGIRYLQRVLLSMEEPKRNVFLSACFPSLLKRCLAEQIPADVLPDYLEALRSLAVAVLPRQEDIDQAAEEQMPAPFMTQSMVSAFLFKILAKALPTAYPIIGLTTDSQDDPVQGGPSNPEQKEAPFPSTSSQRRVIARHPSSGLSEKTITALCYLARDAAAAAPRGLLTLLEEMDTADPTGDGGGDLELSPLALASFVVLLELPGCWDKLHPQVLPIMLSPARRLNILMRACYILASQTTEASPQVVSIGEQDEGEEGAGAPSRLTPQWRLRAFLLLVTSGLGTIRIAIDQNSEFPRSLSGLHCRWQPVRTFRSMLEALASEPDIDRSARGSLFRSISEAMRSFDWKPRFQLYLEIIQKCRVDSIIGAVVTLFKDDWWRRVQALQPNEQKQEVNEELERLIDILKATLSGDVQIVDGMDTLTAALNILRLVSLAKCPAALPLRTALRGGSAGRLDLEKLLNGVSQQIDFELRLLDSPESDRTGESLAELALEAMANQQGGAGPRGQHGDIQAIKRERITMVAHLVA
eukprot:CAMPEP_0206634070 /NCGR_PEP_ID=MMETSP0325_2-20121206/69838_1 /ASSEMBLY_ACC=CAM_ASM_000347 /TAXON_ID=2866 /ORGANISM="Crypthecodinium cohnii, Strain Seligo" /LENGTH=740 /DNA_ID=CAMNT_0054159827 /DNA_START=230 /DNA_END=2448 /DNA_ORIENTATION=-